MKITKTTLRRINAHSVITKKSYCDKIYVIANILCRAAVIIGDSGRYEVNDGSWEILQPWILSDGKREFVSSCVLGEHERKVASGLSTKYPDWISVSLTHGLNGVCIYDINNLVSAILKTKL